MNGLRPVPRWLVSSWAWVVLLPVMTWVCRGQPALPLLASDGTSGVGTGHSIASAISANGRFVVLLSSANNLATNDDRTSWLDVFVWDRVAGTTVLASVNTSGAGGGSGNSSGADIFADGRWVVFESFATNLSVGNTDRVSNVFIRDLLRDETRQISPSSDRPGMSYIGSAGPAISPDGRWVAYVSPIISMPNGAASPKAEIMLYDMNDGTTFPISSLAHEAGAGLGPSSQPVLSGDGRHLAFFKGATNLLDGGVSISYGEVYLVNLDDRSFFG